MFLCAGALVTASRGKAEGPVLPAEPPVGPESYILMGWKVGTSTTLICINPVIYPELKGIVCDNQ
jgi:hypothetical protein